MTVCIECVANALYYQSHLHRYVSSQLWLVFRSSFCSRKIEEFLFFSWMEFVSSGYRSDLIFFSWPVGTFDQGHFFLYFFHDIVWEITLKHVVHDRKSTRPPINSHSTVTTFIFKRNVRVNWKLGKQTIAKKYEIKTVEFPIPNQSDEVWFVDNMLSSKCTSFEQTRETLHPKDRLNFIFDIQLTFKRESPYIA